VKWGKNNRTNNDLLRVARMIRADVKIENLCELNKGVNFVKRERKNFFLSKNHYLCMLKFL